MQSKDSTVNARINASLKRQGNAVLKSMGLTPSMAITLFYIALRQKRCLPFALEPSLETQEALDEVLGKDKIEIQKQEDGV